MTRPIVPDDGPPRTRTVVDVRTLWAGGVATAVVAALVALVTLLLVLYPFSTSAPVSQKIATAAVTLVIGGVIGSLTNGVAARAVRQRRVPPRDDYNQQAPYNQGGNQGGYDQGGGWSQNQWGPSGGRSRGPGG